MRCSISLTAEQVLASAQHAARDAKPFARRVVVTYRGEVIVEEIVETTVPKP